MGFRFSKSIRLGKFIRLNISRSGIGGSVGVGPLRIGTGPRGARLSVDLPGAGTSYVKQWGTGGKTKRAAVRQRESPASEATTPPQQTIPSPVFFAPRPEKELVKGLNALDGGDADSALQHFLAAAEDEPGAAIYASALLARSPEGKSQAVALLEGVVQKDDRFPTPLMEKYLAGASVPVQITPSVAASVALDGLAATLLLVELYQEQGRVAEAVGLLEEIEQLAGDPVLTLSLCELYAAQGEWDGVVERAKETEPSDDVTLETLIYYGRAMQEKRLHDAAVSVFTEALRRKKDRSPHLLREAAYWRAVSYERLGKAAQARREFQKLYAEAPDHRDVAQRVSPTGPGL